jgi:hypothetical protein
MSAPTRILFFDHIARLSGGERSLRELMDRLDRGAYEPELVLLEEGAVAARERGIAVHRLDAGSKLTTFSRTRRSIDPSTMIDTWRCARELARLVAARRCDLFTPTASRPM